MIHSLSELQGNLSDDSCEAHFCPQEGMNHAGSQVSQGTQLLLHHRLRMAAWILFIAFTAFFVRNAVWSSQYDLSLQQLVFPAHVALVFFTAVLAALLTWLHGLCFPRLRVIEVALFGSAGLFLCWMQFNLGCFVSAQNDPGEMRAFLAMMVLPWIILIQVYGLFIPNTMLRAAIILGVMGIAPIVITIAVAAHSESFRHELVRGQMSLLLLWMGVPAAASIYGSHRIELLDQQIRAAQRLGAYTLRKRLGAGGMGEVFLAEHHLLKRPAAIKLIHRGHQDDPNVVARFESEVRTTARLTHPNTVEIYDFGVAEDGTFYYVMEYLPGLDLQDLVDRYGPMSPERVIYLLQQVCSALSEAHSLGVIHRDLKPGNIIASQRGGVFDVAKLLDFGLVKTVTSSPDSLRLTQQGAFVGSPLYSPPELVMGDGSADARTDIYSLGATAYFLLTGKPVFEGEQSMKVMFAHVNEQPLPPSQRGVNTPGDLEAIILKCLAKKPADRFQTARELELALAHCRLAGIWTAETAREWWESNGGDFRISLSTLTGIDAADGSTQCGQITANAVSHSDDANKGTLNPALEATVLAGERADA